MGGLFFPYHKHRLSCVTMGTRVVSLESWYEKLSLGCYHSSPPNVAPLNLFGLIAVKSIDRILYFCRRWPPSRQQWIILTVTENIPNCKPVEFKCSLNLHSRHVWVSDFASACVSAPARACALCSALLYSQASAQRRSQAWSGLAGFQALRLAEAVSVCFVGAAMRTASRGQAWEDTQTHTHTQKDIQRTWNLDNCYHYSLLYHTITSNPTAADTINCLYTRQIIHRWV